MNFFKLISALTAAGAIVACDSSTSSGNGAPNGDLRYSVPFNKGNMSASCNVYSTSNSATMIAEAQMFSSSQKVVMSGTWNNDGSYRAVVDAQMSGMFMVGSGEMCESFKKAYGSDYVECTDGSVKADRTAPAAYAQPLNDETIQTLTNNLVSACDDFREDVQEIYENFSDDPNANGAAAAERATTCDVNVLGNTITQQIVFPTRTATVVYTYTPEIIYVTETYTGVDDVTLQAVCEATKADSESHDVVCNGATITSYNLTEGAPMESFVEFLKDGMCAGFMSGNLTLEEVWFED